MKMERRHTVLTWFCLGLLVAHILNHDEKGPADHAKDIFNSWIEWIYWGVTVFWNWIWIRGGWIWVLVIAIWVTVKKVRRANAEQSDGPSEK